MAYKETREEICGDGKDRQESFAGQGREAAAKAMRLLLNRDRSEKELRDRLGRAGFTAEAADQALEYVKSYGYVNDRRYAENYVMSAGGRKSRAAMRSFLLSKGIDEVTADSALETVPEDERTLIRELLRKKAGEPHEMDRAEQRRTWAYLARRGFSSEDIGRVMREYREQSDFFTD